MFDVAIIGGGVCGCSLLYALSQYKLKTVLLEKENDVGMGTTKANSAIIHAGFDPQPGSLMARSNVLGAKLIPSLCEKLDIPFRLTGSLVLGFKGEESTLQHLYDNGRQNGVEGLVVLGKNDVLQKEPAVNSKIIGALFAPTAGIVSPWELALAQAQAAVQYGAEVHLESPVISIHKENGCFLLDTSTARIEAKFVVNAAGISSSDITALLEEPSYIIQPRRGQYYLLDKSAGELVNHVIFQCPSHEGKGVLVAPTVHGNLIVGPDSSPAINVSTTTEGLAFIKEKALYSVPDLPFAQSIRNFAGLRAHSNQQDFVLCASSRNPGYLEMGGIKSPGLTAAPALALEMVVMLQKSGLILEKRLDFHPRRRIVRFHSLSAKDRADVIRQNPRYGSIVCRCETVTEGDIADTFCHPIPPRSIDAVKRRCGAGMGRCQGGFCGSKVQSMLAQKLEIKKMDVPLDRNGTQLLLGETKKKAHRISEASK